MTFTINNLQRLNVIFIFLKIILKNSFILSTLAKTRNYFSFPLKLFLWQMFNFCRMIFLIICLGAGGVGGVGGMKSGDGDQNNKIGS